MSSKVVKLLDSFSDKENCASELKYNSSGRCNSVKKMVEPGLSNLIDSFQRWYSSTRFSALASPGVLNEEVHADVINCILEATIQGLLFRLE